MDSHQLITKHFNESRTKTLKKLSFQVGTPEGAEDVLQEAYYRALRYFSSFDGRNFDFWFNRIVRSCMIDFKHQEMGHTNDEFDEEEAEGTNCPSYPSHVMRQVYELIDTKSEVQIEVLTMYFKHEYSAKDIASITEHSYAQCHKIISRFREELRQLYKD